MDTHTEKIIKKPVVSVCVITYNRARFLPEAIESVLAQSFVDWEMIIVDDVSTDNTKEIVEKYSIQDGRIKYYKNKERSKISISRNYSLSLAEGKYVAILDSDDVWYDTEKLRLQYDFLESHPGHALIGGGVVVIDERNKEQKRFLNPLNDSTIRRRILWQNPFAHSSVMYDREAVLKLGGYDVLLHTAEDYDLFLRIGRVAKFANLGRHVLNYRVHDSNITATDRLKTMELAASLVKKNKKIYPGYYRAMLWRGSKIFVYRLLSKFH